jgi:hypothetical protein
MIPVHGSEPPDRLSTPELIRSIVSDTSTLVRKEIELGKAEILEAIMARVKGVALVAAAGVVALLMVTFLALAAAVALDIVMPGWASRLTVAGALLVLSGLGALLGVRRMKKPSFAPEQAKRSVKEDVAWARNQLKR